MPKNDQKLSAQAILKSALKRSLHPRHLWALLNLRRSKPALARAYDDPQLKLYAEVFPGDFLNYGHFPDPALDPRQLSLNDIYQAQARNAELIVDLIADRSSPVLDVGCGMGGLDRLMLERGLNPVALSPDRNQIRHVKARYPQLTVIETRFEDLPLADHLHRYGTIITSESLQFLNLAASLPLMEKLLKPGGRWIACDCFRTGEERHRSSGHVWSDFERRVLDAGWKFVSRQDHTPHVMPTLRFLHMWGNDIARPAVRFAFEKFHAKQPASYYILEEVIEALQGKIHKNLDLIDPQTFAAYTRYMLLAMERTG
jgi:cyclopropane fatty-acyl-phospholipid synthase-like methyltransferase